MAELPNALVDRMLCNETVHDDSIGLPHAVRPCNRLILGCRLELRLHDDDCGCALHIQAENAYQKG